MPGTVTEIVRNQVFEKEACPLTKGRMSELGGCIVGAKHGRQNLGRSPREYLRPCFARTQNGD